MTLATLRFASLEQALMFNSMMQSAGIFSHVCDYHTFCAYAGAHRHLGDYRVQIPIGELENARAYVGALKSDEPAPDPLRRKRSPGFWFTYGFAAPEVVLYLAISHLYARLVRAPSLLDSPPRYKQDDRTHRRRSALMTAFGVAVIYAVVALQWALWAWSPDDEALAWPTEEFVDYQKFDLDDPPLKEPVYEPVWRLRPGERVFEDPARRDAVYEGL